VQPWPFSAHTHTHKKQGGRRGGEEEESKSDAQAQEGGAVRIYPSLSLSPGPVGRSSQEGNTLQNHAPKRVKGKRFYCLATSKTIASPGIRLYICFIHSPLPPSLPTLPSSYSQK
jgi:hypothetical protein